MVRTVLRIFVTALGIAVTALPALGQSSIQFRSVSSELANRPRGGVIDLFGGAPASPSVTRPQDSAPWYWEVMSPQRAAADRMRFGEAWRAAAEGPVGRPSAATLTRIAAENRAALDRAYARSSLSQALLLAVIATESAGRADAISPKGAVGLMQLMPGTAREVGVENPLDAAQNIAGGARYLSRQLLAHEGDAILALAAYNAGPGAVDRASGVPAFAETRAYVPKVLAAFAVARDLCLDPPVAPRAECVLDLVTAHPDGESEAEIAAAD
ncbi:lytic transglycosylase domain-containing protein [Pontivivens ytuae]|uniref:Lytic transglycosylase domain-containing protein n=1 Tax=Pontivivens ytuae TaxID=2789856 RepID=A0A7S9LU66_9RHOB|nr:lytic transglycosylase domain-containing protein [Pontivivens ytuae]QPH55302.1 lytic transglycosylase domain-containing protein [Pontivivens ytuae]